MHLQFIHKQDTEELWTLSETLALPLCGSYSLRKVTPASWPQIYEPRDPSELWLPYP